MENGYLTETIIIANPEDSNFYQVLDVINTKIRRRPTTIIAGSDITISKIVDSMNFFTQVDNIQLLIDSVFDEENDGTDFIGAIQEINQYIDSQRVLVVLAPKIYANWLAPYFILFFKRAQSVSCSALNFGVWTIKMSTKNNKEV